MAITTLPPGTGTSPAAVVGGAAVVSTTGVVSSVPGPVVSEAGDVASVVLLPVSSLPQATPIRPALMTKAASSLPGLRRDGAFK